MDKWNVQLIHYCTNQFCIFIVYIMNNITHYNEKFVLITPNLTTEINMFESILNVLN